MSEDQERMPGNGTSATGRARKAGILVPIGGAEDRPSDGAILQRFLEEAGGLEARSVIVPTVSKDPEAGRRYRDTMKRLGPRSVGWLGVAVRAESSGAPALDRLRESSGISIGGGDQARLVGLLAGTLVRDLIAERHRAGAVVDGQRSAARHQAAVRSSQFPLDSGACG